MYLIIHPCFYICFVDVKQLPEDEQARLKYVGVMTNFVGKCNLNISAFVGFIV